jgi:hypothetical protein
MWRKGSWSDEARKLGFSNQRIQELVSEHELENKIDGLLFKGERISKSDFMKLFEQYNPYVSLLVYWNDYSAKSKDQPKAKKPTLDRQLELFRQRRNDVAGQMINYGPYRGFPYPDGFKSKNSLNITPKNSFPLKKFKKLYSLHHFAPPDSYMVDIAFFKDFMDNMLAFLILVNINTRKAYAELINGVQLDDDDSGSLKILKDSKSAGAFLSALVRILNKNELTVKFLKGDSEKAFNSKMAASFYKDPDKPIIFIPVPISFGQTNHTSLSIIDRLIRTIRDALYNMGIDFINPKIMEEILRQYNAKPHRTLSKIFKKPTSPNQVTEKMEMQVIRNAKQRNSNTFAENLFKIADGTKVFVYNDKDPMTKRRSVVKKDLYEIIGFKNGLYFVKGPDGKINAISRYKIKL